MRFLAPERLWLLVPVVILGILYVVMQYRRRAYAVRFSDVSLIDEVAPKRPGWRRHLTAAIAGLAAISIVIGLAQPARETQVASEETIVMLAIDTSRSMTAVDVSPSRIAVAIDQAVAFVEDLPDGLDVGLVSFDDTARLVVSPTQDHATVIAAIKNLRTGAGTAGGDAIETSLESIQATMQTKGMSIEPDESDDDKPPASIVMLSDGDTSVGMEIPEATQLAINAGVPISTITYGTDAGTVLIEDVVYPVPPATETMQKLADDTGGHAYEAASADELAAVYEDIEAGVATETTVREYTLWFVLAGFVLLMTSAAMAFVWTNRFL